MLSALTQARANGYGRIALGLGMVAAPERSAAWLGQEARRPGVHALTRMLGIRDVILGFLTVHTAARSGIGPRTLATVAVADAVDFAAVAAVRDRLPSTGAASVMAIAAGSAVQLTAVAVALR